MNVDEEATKRSYEKTERRTRVVALLYDCLIETDEDIRVDMATYLEFIVQEIIQVERPPGALEFDIELERAEMSIERAPVCGLLIHELVMNAVRHVYNGEQHGTVRVEFHPLEDSEDDDYHFLVADDGRGLPGDFDWRNDGSVGMKLIRNITEQKFGGTLKCTVDNGTTFEGSF